MHLPTVLVYLPRETGMEEDLSALQAYLGLFLLLRLQHFKDLARVERPISFLVMAKLLLQTALLICCCLTLISTVLALQPFTLRSLSFQLCFLLKNLIQLLLEPGL